MTGGCPLTARGIRLRALCEGCAGRPARGQRSLKRGAVLFVAGTRAEHLHLVVDGWLAQTRCTDEGREQGMRLAGPGSVLGAEALLAPSYETSVRALSDAQVCYLPAGEVRQVLARDPAQGVALNAALVEEILELQSQLLRVTSRQASARLVGLLEQLAPPGKARWVELPLAWTDVATLLSLSPEAVSRALRGLEDEGVLERRRRSIRWLDAGA